MVHQWGFFGSISAIRKIWSLTANSRSLQAAALKNLQVRISKIYKKGWGKVSNGFPFAFVWRSKPFSRGLERR